MKCQIHLYLKGVYQASKEVEFSNTEINTTEKPELTDMRQEELKHAMKIMEFEYTRQILKCNKEFYIVPVFQSSMNYQSIKSDYDE